ncbi:hypothetical protein MLC35_01065 [Sulfurimonas sp. NW7]|uniref:hypothetical protein n=1 Tax=Sulfurimonas sp. NW7 TaxID=2922727 RepID=UPI003DA86D74
MQKYSPCESKAFGLEEYSSLVSEESSHVDDIKEHVIKDGLKIIYKNIIFDDVSLPFHATLEKELLNGVKHIEIDNCVFQKNVFINVVFETLSIKQSCFEGKFYINNQYNNPNKVLQLEALHIEDVKFYANFKLHNCELKNFALKDTDFEKNADFFKTKFLTNQDIVFHAINFRALALFGDTFFKEHLLFEYVTFAGYSHFRKATFCKGLNLEYANIEKEMNFFGVKELDKKPSIELTSQETYRTVKYQLQKVGNIIESNKYHALELQKKKESVCKCSCKIIKTIPDCLTLSVHKVSSNYSTNWVWALGWILAVGLLTSYILKDELFYSEFYKYSSLLSSLDDFSGIYWLFMLNKIMLGYLYYQFVTAVRKDTRK